MRIWTFLFGLSWLVLVGGCQPEERAASAEAAAGAAPLVVGMELAYPPFEMTGPDGEPKGVSVELARALAKELGRPLQIEDIQFAGLIPALQSGRVDLVISSMTATEERAKSVAFSDSYLQTGLALLVPRHSLVEGIEDLNRKKQKVAVKAGTTGQTYAAAHLKEAEVMVFDRAEAAVLEVAQGRADAFIYDQMSVDQYARRHAKNTRPILEAFAEESWAVAMRRTDGALREQVNAFLKKFAGQGGFERLGDTYLRETKDSFQAQGVPFVF